jgi:hypothetical protein
MTDRFAWVNDVAPYLPASIGALIGLRYAKEQTAGQKIVSCFIGFAIGVYGGAAVAEFFNLGAKGTAGSGLIVGAIGYDAIGGLLAVVSQFKENPVAVGRRWINAWFGRSDQ